MNRKHLHLYAIVISSCAGFMSMLLPLAEMHSSWQEIGVCLMWGLMTSVIIYMGMISWYDLIISVHRAKPVVKKQKPKSRSRLEFVNYDKNADNY